MMGSDSLPEPLVPADCDLHDYPFMPLDVGRLRDAEIVDAVTGNEFRAAVLLWCTAWHQMPAGSLPDDDVQLAKYAGYGRVVKEWLKVKQGALHGFIKCSDGRLYHTTVCEKAMEAHLARKKASSRGKAGATKRWGAWNAPSIDGADNNDGLGTNSESSKNAHAMTENRASINPATENHSKDKRGEDKRGEGSDLQSDAPALNGHFREGKPRYPADFGEFWKSYPTDKNMSKHKAFQQWGRLSDFDKNAALGAIPGYREFCAKDRTYRPVHAVKFLEERRFEGFKPEIIDPEVAAAAKDRADKLLRRGKYAE